MRILSCLATRFVYLFIISIFIVDTCGFQGIDGHCQESVTGEPFLRQRPCILSIRPKSSFLTVNFDLITSSCSTLGKYLDDQVCLTWILLMNCVDEFKTGSNIFFWDQGILNYLLNKGHQEGRFTLGGECFRIPGYDPPEKLAQPYPPGGPERRLSRPDPDPLGRPQQAWQGSSLRLDS